MSRLLHEQRRRQHAATIGGWLPWKLLTVIVALAAGLALSLWILRAK